MLRVHPRCRFYVVTRKVSEPMQSATPLTLQREKEPLNLLRVALHERSSIARYLMSCYIRVLRVNRVISD